MYHWKAIYQWMEQPYVSLVPIVSLQTISYVSLFPIISVQGKMQKSHNYLSYGSKKILSVQNI